MSFKQRILASRWIVPALVVLILASAVGGLLWLTKAIGENLVPAKPRVIIFGASWCGNCPREAELAKLADEFPNIVIEHVDIDESPGLKQFFGIKQVPTFVVLDDPQPNPEGRIKAKAIYRTGSISELRSWLHKREHDHVKSRR